MAKRTRSVGVEYTGKRSKTGNSMGFRFEGALFKSHPEFNGEVRARVIAPGRMLVVAETPVTEESDPVLSSFLAFFQYDMVRRPDEIVALDEGPLDEIGALVEGVCVRGDEDLGADLL